MSDTEQLFVIAGVWAVIAAFVVRFIPNWWGRAALFAALVGIPFWELPYGYYNFQNLCREETKLQVLEKIPPQDSVCIDRFDTNLYSMLVRNGFSRIELLNESENAKQYLANGRLFLTNRKPIESAYCIRFENNVPLPWRVLRSDILIVRDGDRRVVGRQSRFRWDGTWWQKNASPIFGIGGICETDWNSSASALRGRLK